MLKRIDILKYKWIIAIFILALLVRTLGISHGFPFIFHPDEPAVVRSAMGFRFNLNPKHFDWPSLHFYLNYFVFSFFISFRSLLQILNLKKMIISVYPLLWRDPLVFYLISRFFNAFLGAFTVVPIYLIGKRLFNSKVGLLSALVLALFPFHSYSSHFALVDVPMVFWLTWGIYFTSGILKENNLKNYIYAGLFFGFSASTKYNGGLGVFTIVVAHCIRIFLYRNEKLLSASGLSKFFIAGLFSILGFVFGTPYSVLDFDKFIRSDSPIGALWQFTNVGKVNFISHIQQFVSSLTYGFANDFGYSFLLLFIASPIVFFSKALKKEDKFKVAFLFIPAIVLFYYISGFEKNRSHYYAITYPYVVLIVGYFNLLRENKKIVLYLIFSLVFIPPFFLILKDDFLFIRKDTRVMLYNYISSHQDRSNTVFYSSNSLSIVLDKFSHLQRKKVNGELFRNRMSKKILDKGIFLTTKPQEGLKLSSKIGNRLRRGPEIYLYEVN